MVSTHEELRYACSEIHGLQAQIKYIMDKHPQATRKRAEREIKAYLLLEAITEYYAKRQNKDCL